VKKPPTRPTVFGVGLDSKTRCAHYHSPQDVIAIKAPCCDEYWACHKCHEEMAEHKLEPWLKTDEEKLAVLCGECGTELTISEYKNSDSNCPACGAQFNEGCKLHWDIYFSKER
jgi:uncharacterized CHY-type Zn-finger protein